MMARPRAGLLREAMRILPDALRLIRRLAADGFAALCSLAGLNGSTSERA